MALNWWYINSLSKCCQWRFVAKLLLLFDYKSIRNIVRTIHKTCSCLAFSLWLRQFFVVFFVVHSFDTKDFLYCVCEREQPTTIDSLKTRSSHNYQLIRIWKKISIWKCLYFHVLFKISLSSKENHKSQPNRLINHSSPLCLLNFQHFYSWN